MGMFELTDREIAMGRLKRSEKVGRLIAFWFVRNSRRVMSVVAECTKMKDATGLSGSTTVNRNAAASCSLRLR